MIKYMNRIFGTILFAIAASVLLGWYIRSIPLITWGNNLVPVQYNTALCFLFTAMTLFFCSKRHYPMAKIMLVPVFTIAALTIGQYLHDLNFGIDTLFLKPWYEVNTSHPGRMAPNTAACFIIDAVCLYVISRDRNNYLETVIFNTFSFSIGALSLFGRIFQVENFYGWGNFTRMALATSVCFLLTSIAIYIDVFRKYKSYKGETAELINQQRMRLKELGGKINE